MMAISFAENFNTYTATGFAPSPAAGQLDSDHWAVTGMGSPNTALGYGQTRNTFGFARGLQDEFYSTSGFFTYDAPNNNRFFAIKPSGGELTPSTITVRTQNDAVVAQDPVISFDYWERNDSSTSTKLSVSYSIDGEAFVPVASLGFTTVAALSNPSFVFSSTKSITLTGVTIPAHYTFDLRWSNEDGATSGTFDAVGIDNISITTSAPNAAPTISAIADQSTLSFTPKTVDFTIGDAETAATLLNVSATSSNPAVLPNANISFGGSGANRTLTATPIAGTGSTTITVTVTDAGGRAASEDFLLTVDQAWTLSMPQSLSAAQGQFDVVEIPILLNSNGTPASPLFSIDLPVTYETNVMTIEGVTLGSALSAPALMAGVFSNASTDPGKISILITVPGGLATPINGNVAIIRARIKPTATLGDTRINLRSSEVIDNATVTTELNEGLLTLGPPPTDASNDALADAKLTILANSQPALDAINGQIIDEDTTPPAVPLSGITAGVESQQIAFITSITNLTGDPDTSLVTSAGVTYTSPDSTGTLNYAIAAGASGTAIVKVLARDAGPDGLLLTSDDGFVQRQFTVKVNAVNDPPTLAPIVALPVDEDASTQVLNLTGITAGDGEGQTLSVTAVSDNPSLIPHPSIPYASPSNTTTLSYTPEPNRSGKAKITVTVRDAGLDGMPGTSDDGITEQEFTITVNPVNDAPTMTTIDPITLDEDAATKTVSLTGISAGPLETQDLSITVSSNNTDLIPTPTLLPYTSPGSTASILFTPVANLSGTAKVKVTVRDTGLDGIAGNSDDGITEQEFTVTVNPQNDAPTLDTILDRTFDEDTLSAVINLSGITAGGGENQGLSISAVSDKPDLIPNPSVPYSSPSSTASFTIAPLPNQSGTAKITVTVRDAGLDGIPGNIDDATFSQQFTVNVTAVNDLPTLDAILSRTVDEDALTQTVNLTGITAGGGESQKLKITAVSDTPDLIPNPSVPYTSPSSTAVLSYSPVGNKWGTAKITVTVRDAGADNEFDTLDDATFAEHFNVTVNPVNDPPTLAAIDPLPLNEDFGTKTVALTGITAGPFETGLLSVSAVSDKPALIPTVDILPYTSPSSTATLQFTSAPNQSGTAKITVTVRDAGFDGILNTADDATFDQQLFITVTAVNDEPTLGPIVPGTISIDEDALSQTVNLSGITAGGGEVQDLTVTATSDNPDVIPHPSIPYTSPSSTALLSYAPVSNKWGSARITVTVRDAGIDGIAGNADDKSISQFFDVTVNPLNDAPTLSAIGDRPVSEDAGLQTVSLTGISAGPFESQDLSISVVSSNTELIPTPTLLPYTSPSPTAAMEFTPVANQSGTAKLKVTVRDKGFDGIAGNSDDGITEQEFTVNVAAVNDAPTMATIVDRMIAEDTLSEMINLTGITAGGGETQGLTITAVSDRPDLIPNPSIPYSSPSNTASFTIAPLPNQSGIAKITVTVRDAGLDGIPDNADDKTFSQQFTVNVTAVNDQPTLDAILSPSISEDSLTQTVNLSGITAGGGESQKLKITAVSENTDLIPTPLVPYSSPSSSAVLTYSPVADKWGSSKITVKVQDAGADGEFDTLDDATFEQQFTVTVNPVNDTPTITTVAPLTIAEDFGTKTVSLSGITAGPFESQTLSVTAVIDTPALIAVAEILPYASPSSTATLQFTPVANQSGSAKITVVVRDAGADGLLNTSDDATFNESVFVTITEVNDEPTLAPIAPTTYTIDEDALTQTVNLSGITAGGGETQNLTVTATSDNPDVIPNPSIPYTSPSSTAVLSYSPAPNKSGSAKITVSVRDAGLDGIPGNADDKTVSHSFDVTVNPVNDAPTLTALSDVSLAEDAGLQTVSLSGISAGPFETQELSITVVSDNTDLIPNPTMLPYTSPSPTASLQYMSVANKSGNAKITVTVTDNGLDGIAGNADDKTVSQQFTVSVAAVNDAPSFTKGTDQTVLEDASGQSVPWATAISSGPNENDTVNFVVTGNDRTELFAAGPVITPDGKLTYTPALNANGTATIRVKLVDNGPPGGTNESPEQTFTITLTPVNDAPSFVKGTDPILAFNAGPQTLSSWAQNISRGALNETAQTLNFTVSVLTNPGLFAVAPAIASDGTLTFTPTTGQSGSATVSVFLKDNDGVDNSGSDTSATETFTITVNPQAANVPPTIAAIAPQATNEDSGSQTVNFSGVTTGGETQTLKITAASSNTAIIPDPVVTYTSANPTGSLTYSPAANMSGNVTITITVRDAGHDGILDNADDGITQTGFVVTVNEVNDAPGFTKGLDPSVSEDAGPQSIPLWATEISAGVNETGAVNFVIESNSNAQLFEVTPAISPTGTLTFTPAANAHGTATIVIKLLDAGGTDNGGVNASATQSFVITVSPTNDSPTIAPVGNLSLLENAAPQTVLLGDIAAGGGETQSLRVTASSSNPGLIPAPSITYTSPDSTGSLSFTSEFDQIGISTITVTVRDWGLNGLWDDADDGETQMAFTVEVTRANRPPVANDNSVNTPFNTAVDGQLPVSDADGPSLTYTLLMSPVSGTLTSLNTATGAFTYQPSAGFTGVDVFTFHVSDGEYSDTATMRVVTQAPVATVQVIDTSLLVEGMPREDVVLMTRVSATSVLVRTGNDSAVYPLPEGVSGIPVIRTGDANDYVVLRGITNHAIIELGAGDDIALTGAGEDHITGGLGNDIIAAGDGPNLVRGDEWDATITEGGNDVITGGNDRDAVYGGGGNDRIVGYAGDNYLRGNAGNDTIFGGDGPDFILGGAGNDALYGGLGDDVIAGNDGNDTLSGSSGDDVLIGGFGTDQIDGGENHDLIIGGETTTTNEEFAVDLLQMLATWVASHPANLATSVLSPDDLAVDTLLGSSGDDDFYLGAGDITPDYRISPEHGNDRRFP